MKKIIYLCAISIIGIASLMGATKALAYVEDPSGCYINSVTLGITAFRADGTTPIGGGHVQAGETIKYQAFLSTTGYPSCYYQGGTVHIHLPNSVQVDVTPLGGIPEITTLNSPFSTLQATYVVSPADVNGSGNIIALAHYIDGTSLTPTASSTATAETSYPIPFQAESLTITKTAVPVEEIPYTWTIDKSVTPATWNLFVGNGGTSQYTINLMKIPGASTQSVSGTITIYNPADFASAHVTGVSDVITGSINATVTCPGGLPQDIAPGGTLICTYSASLPDITTRTNTAIVTTTGDVAGGSGTASIDFTSVVPTEVNGTVSIDDTYNGGDAGPFSDSTSYNYSRQFVCGSGVGQYTGLGNNINNTATIVGTQISDSAAVTVNCYALTVTKTAQTSYDRKYSWEINKTVADTSLTLALGQTFDMSYSVIVNTTGYVDSNTTVTGTITVHNPASFAATINSVSDVISPAITATVDCGVVSFPYSLAGGGDLSCTYSASLSDKTSRTNTATAVLQNYNFDYQLNSTPTGTTNFTGTANVTFGAPANITDECINVSDTLEGVLGTVCVGIDALPKTFTYTRTIGPYEVCGDYTISNTASFITNDTQTTGNASQTVNINVPCAMGCTLTPGYWKTHNASFKGGAPIDDTWNLITPLAELSGFFTTANSYLVSGPNNITVPFTWFSVFWTAPKGNAYYNLSFQYEAAILNKLSGASSTSAVDAALTSAQALFTQYTPAQVAAFKGNNTTRQQFISLAGILGNYNSGLIGPGHCDEDSTTSN